MFLAIVFALLLVASFARAGLPDLRGKTGSDWVLDVLGLTIQGTFVPLAQTLLLAGLFTMLAPQLAASVHLHPLAAFALNFVVVDYVYYWNHRLLHTKTLWPVHAVHHTMDQMDVLGTSRNTLWSSALIVYLWVNGLFLWLLADPAPYAAAIALTAAGDLWCHSTLQPPAPIGKLLSRVLVMPVDHAWHHSADEPNINFGANFTLWDRLHGTYSAHDDFPEALGVPLPISLGRKLLWPF